MPLLPMPSVAWGLAYRLLDISDCYHEGMKVILAYLAWEKAAYCTGLPHQRQWSKQCKSRQPLIQSCTEIVVWNLVNFERSGRSVVLFGHLRDACAPHQRSPHCQLCAISMRFYATLVFVIDMPLKEVAAAVNKAKAHRASQVWLDLPSY